MYYNKDEENFNAALEHALGWMSFLIKPLKLFQSCCQSRNTLIRLKAQF